MITPTLTEVAIVICGFSLVGLYMFIAHRIVKSSEENDRRSPSKAH